MATDNSRENITLRRLHHLMSQVNASEDLEVVLQTIAEGVADVVGFQVAVISYLHPDDVMEVMAVAGDEKAKAQLTGGRTPLSTFHEEFTLADEWGILRFVPHDRLPEEDMIGWVPDVEPLDGPDAWHPLDALFAPLSAPTGEMIGMMSVDLPHDGRLPDQFQREVLEMYAVQAGIAINNAKQRNRLVEQVRLAGAVHAVAQTAGRDLDLGRVVDESLQPIVSGLRCHAAWIRTFEGEGERPGRGRGAIYPADASLVPPDEVLAIARRVALTTWAEQRAAVVSERETLPTGMLDEEESRLILDFVGKIGSRSLLFVPLGAGPECLGYMSLTRTEDAPHWSDEEVSAALGIGRDLGLAILHARIFEREREIVEELQQLDAYKTELISTVTHELKNPLTSIILSLELIQMSEHDPETEQWLAAIERNSGRLRNLVEDLLLLSKVRDPNQPLIPAEVDMTATIRDAVELFALQADQRSVKLDFFSDSAVVTAWGDPAELDRVASNLIGNAIKFSPPGGTVRLSLSATDREVVFRCSDEGIGISRSDQENLFTEFYRTNNPAALAVPGSGLGLTIVKRIVDRHGGAVSVTSDIDAGSTFTVTLPGPAIR